MKTSENFGMMILRIKNRNFMPTIVLAWMVQYAFYLFQFPNLEQYMCMHKQTYIWLHTIATWSALWKLLAFNLELLESSTVSVSTKAVNRQRVNSGQCRLLWSASISTLSTLIFMIQAHIPLIHELIVN